MPENAGAEQQVQVMYLPRQPSGTHIEIGLHEEFPGSEGAIAALLAKSLNTDESGVKIR